MSFQAPEWRSVMIRTSRGALVPLLFPESLVGVAWPKLDQALGTLSFSCCIYVGRPRGGGCSAGRVSHRKRSPRCVSASLLWAQRRHRLRAEQVARNKRWAKKRIGPDGGPKSSKLMRRAPAQRRAIQSDGREPPILGLCRMGRRPNRFGLPSKTGSKLNRTIASGKVSLRASTDTYISLANLSFRHSGRAH
jgi:hypothetical protein